MLGTAQYQLQLSKTQKKQARSLVLNGKATNQRYAAAVFWTWNSGVSVVPTKSDVKRQTALYNIGFPSVYQTSEHLRFDLVERPRRAPTGRPVQLGIGHTVCTAPF